MDNVEFGRIAIIGMGNVGKHLLTAFTQNNISVAEIYTRDYNESKSISEYFPVTPVKEIATISADLCIVCVSDRAINDVINQLPRAAKIAYTSGSVELDIIDRKEQIGVFYPLQTFSKEMVLNYREIPFFIESYSPEISLELFQLASKISEQVHFSDSDLRKKMHLAAVFVNNFVNHQIYIAEQLSCQFAFDPEVLLPLLKETVNKAIVNGAFLSQTGPAKRGESLIISQHEQLLDNDNFKAIYKAITKSIISTYHDKL